MIIEYKKIADLKITRNIIQQILFEMLYNRKICEIKTKQFFFLFYREK